MSAKLTQRQRQILDFIAGEVRNKGYPPSVREIGAAVGLSSSSTVHSHLSALQKKGYIRRDPSKPRALLLSERDQSNGDNAVTIPLVGHVAAGQPILAEENVIDQISWPKNMSSTPSFALTVKGDSMTGAGILADDVVMVRQQPTAENGDLVVALIEDEATVKRFYLEPNRIRLEPANPAFQPIFTTEAVVVGKVVGLLRRI